MLATFAIAGRDLKGFFGTPLGWIAACIQYLVSGIVFFIIVTMILGRGQSIDPVGEILAPILAFLNYINIFIIPAFTMRVMSEEISTGTYRLHSAAPISSWEIVLGKFFGVMFYFVLFGFFLTIYPLFTYIFSQPDLRIVLGGALGLILNCSAIIAISLFIASLTKNLVLSYLGSAFFIVLFIFSSFMSGMPLWYKNSVNILNLSNDFSKGIVKTGSVFTYLGIIVTFLILARFVVECRKWRV